MDCLRHFVAVLIDEHQWSRLCSLPFSGMENEVWIFVPFAVAMATNRLKILLRVELVAWTSLVLTATMNCCTVIMFPITTLEKVFLIGFSNPLLSIVQYGVLYIMGYYMVWSIVHYGILYSRAV